MTEPASEPVPVYVTETPAPETEPYAAPIEPLEPATYPLNGSETEPIREPITEPVTESVTEPEIEPLSESESSSAPEITLPPQPESPAAPSSAMQETSPAVIDLPLAGMIYTGEEIYGFTGQEIVLNIIVDPGRTYRFEGNKKPEEGLWPASDSYICEIDETDGSYRFIRF